MYNLVGVSENAFSIIGYTENALKETGHKELVKIMKNEVANTKMLKALRTGDYNSLINVCKKYIDVANGKEKENV